MILGYQHETGGIGVLVPVNESFFDWKKPVPLDGNHVMSWLVRFDTVSRAPDLKLNGYALNWGEMSFASAPQSDGEILVGTLQCDLIKIPIH
jgi:hypothetical protein